jgi:hypothetical protein
VTTAGGSSIPATFAVTPYPTPAIGSINVTPTPIDAGADLTLQIIGFNFDSSNTTDTVLWTAPGAGQVQQPLTQLTALSATSLTVQVPATDNPKSGAATVMVQSQSQDGSSTTTSNSYTVNILPPAPIISPSAYSVTQASSAIDQPTSLTINGNYFIPNSTTVNWSGPGPGPTGTQTATPTITNISTTSITISLQASLLTTTGTATLTVSTPSSPPGAGATASIAITQAGSPQIASSNPFSPASGTQTVGPGFPLLINGSNFNSNATVQWNGTPLSGAVVTGGTQINVPVPAYSPTAATGSFNISAGTAEIIVTNPATATNPPVSSPQVPYTINPATPTVAVVPSSTNINALTSLPVTVTVTAPASSSFPPPVGQVVLTSGSYMSAAQTLSSGTATFTIPAGSLNVGQAPTQDRLTATYTPDPTVIPIYGTGTTTGNVEVTVTPVAVVKPAVTVTPSAPSLTTAQSLTLTVNVATTPNYPAPTGTVALSSTTGVLSQTATTTATVTEGVATFSLNPGDLAPGSDALSITYKPSTASGSYYNSATGAATVTVTAATPTVTVTPAATTITTGQALPVSISVSDVSDGSNAPTPVGNVKLSSGGTTLGTAPLCDANNRSTCATSTQTPGTATITVPYGVLAVGTDTVMVTYAPGSSQSSIYAANTGTAQVTVTGLAKSTPSLTVVSGVNGPITTSTTGNPTTVTVTISGTPPPSGMVTLNATSTTSSGSYTATQTFINGYTAFTIQPGTLATPGIYALSAAYTPDAGGAAIYNRATGTAQIPLTVTSVGSLAVGSTDGSLTVASSGTSATSTITITPAGGFTGTINLSCQVTTGLTNYSDLPACSLASTLLTVTSGTDMVKTTLTVQTTKAASKMAPPLKGFFLGGGGAALAGVLLVGFRSRRRYWARLFGLVLAVAFLGAIFGVSLGCGGGYIAPAAAKNPGTTPGAYVVTVTGADAATGKISSTSTLNIIVQ